MSEEYEERATKRRKKLKKIFEELGKDPGDLEKIKKVFAEIHKEDVKESLKLYEKDEVIVILNPGPAVRDLFIPTHSKTKKWRDIITDKVYKSDKGSVKFQIIHSNGYMILTSPISF